ncbi:FecCD family ABC transporter permease [Algibacter lectus]|jgi:iron complex transport system permease protein|uniref:Vitamin B12 ABC transporter permease component BtuC n=1 Tax=Algibacter lectus TaxID=221126 RepID=A0A090W8Z1_9FLAO|nr:iron ABC transporter permease [Algibacter lectus]MDO7137649.1 iron ABC transporter permease [Algibacter lectus]GAL63972.1 vitamin B12 ABC transporter permease component BtuC [Algibacter lectus]SFD11350.1 iron complex transport system permease protein [Algibacter lectus]
MNKTYTYSFLALALTLVLCFFVNISLGSVSIPLKAVFNSLLNSNVEQQSWQHIILNYRLPKAITAIIVGSGLGISGLLMQTLFRNPLAGPFVLGISSGASLGVALVILGSGVFGGVLASLFVSKWGIVIAASLGSFLVLLAVLMVSIRVRDTMAILIIGLMFASITAAIVSVLSYFGSAEQLQQYVFWGFGSLGNLSWSDLTIFLIIYVLGILASLCSIKSLNTLLLGENYAKSLGLNIKKSRLIIIIATSLLAGTITAFTGPIAFIGLAIPHLTRQIFNTSNHKILLPAVFLLGGIVMLVCDSIAQLPNSDYTLPINAITALIGAPVVIWLLVRKRGMVF